MKRLILLRHTQTAFNRDPIRLRGGLDIPLSPEGLAQIPTVVEKIRAQFPDIKAVYTSPLERASILATTIAHEYSLRAVRVEDMKSWDYGAMNGKPVSEVLDALKALTTNAGREMHPYNGESMNGFLRRWTKALHDVITLAPEDGHVLVVTHLQNVMTGRAYLIGGMPEDVSKMDYEYKESNEIAPGEWVELRREWTIQFNAKHKTKSRKRTE